jgi:hypothetical protein
MTAFPRRACHPSGSWLAVRAPCLWRGARRTELMVASPALASRVPPTARRRGRGTKWSLPRREASETSQSARRRPYSAGECESSTDDLSATHGTRAASRSISSALRAVVDPQSNAPPGSRGGGEHKDHHQRRYFHVGIGRGRPSGGGRSRCVTYSPRHARCHFLTPIDSRAHETRGIAPCADDVFAKANAVALVSAPFLPEPGSQARVVDGGQVLHVSRLGEPRYSPRLADCARTPPRGAPVVLARGRIDRHRPARQRRRPGLGGARLPHLPAGCPQARTGDHQQRAPRRRRPLHSSRARAVQGGAGRGPRHRSPRSANACATCEQSRLFPRPATRPSRWSRSTPAPGSSRPTRSTSPTCAWR